MAVADMSVVIIASAVDSIPGKCHIPALSGHLPYCAAAPPAPLNCAIFEMFAARARG
jgi:hypothetical protein